MNKLNSIAAVRQLINLASTLAPTGYRRRQRNQNFIRKMWNPNYNSNTFQARRRIRRKRNQIEINKAEGKNKIITDFGPIRRIAINSYSAIYVQQDTLYYILQNSLKRVFNFQEDLRASQEFQNWKYRAAAFKFETVCISFNYNRIPNGGEKFAKILLTISSDMIPFVDNPDKNRNSMIWDMSHNGTKNFNFRITNRNTEKINQEWQNPDSDWSGVLKCSISEVDQASTRVKPDTELGEDFPIKIGELKITYRIAFRLTDTSFAVREMPSTAEAINYIKKQIVEERKQKAQVRREKLENIKKQFGIKPEDKLNKSF